MENEKPSVRERVWKSIKGNLLTYLLVLGVLLGIVTGIIIRVSTDVSLNDRQSTYLGFPGDLLIRLLKCVALPLIVTCLIVAIGSLDIAASKTMGWQIIVLVITTKLISATIGVIVTVILKPGKGAEVKKDDEEEDEVPTREVAVPDVFLDMMRNLIADNMIRLYVDIFETRIITPEVKKTDDINYWDFEIVRAPSINLLGMIFLAILTGLCLTIIQEKGARFLTVASEVYQITMVLAIWILWCAPVALFFLILAEILKIKDFGPYFITWGMYIVCVHLGYAIILLIMFPLLLLLITRTNPFKFYGSMARALITGYATASSVASMPPLIACLQDYGIDPRMVGFVVPIIINTNKDGTACFLAIATVFIAQMKNVSLSVGQYVTIIILSSMGSIAAAGVPFAAVLVLLMLINALGLDASAFAGIMSVEWLNDRAQTLVNIAGNAAVTKILATWNEKSLRNDPQSS